MPNKGGSTQRLADLLDAPEREQRRLGYFHTAREIDQQPETWLETAEVSLPALATTEGPVYLTGSGSSYYIGESLEPILARKLGRRVRAVPAGSFLTFPESILGSDARGTLVSFARSGDSPESIAVVDWFLRTRPGFRHLVLTCNAEGALATRYSGRDDVDAVVLSDRTNDRSLVMTSSFTNLWLAGRLLAGRDIDVTRLAAQARTLLDGFSPSPFAFSTAIFLGTGERFGAAREAALKMLEMCDGIVPTFADTFLGFRHGPMCAARNGALLVGFRSSEEPARAYERDLLRELERKKVASRLFLVGEDGDVRFDAPDDDVAILDVVVGQLLALFRCLSLGLDPDAPSRAKVITRVVERFPIHDAARR
ncbi:MAG TPA: tagatose-6-phosphate ketose isomerase [Vicinamibacteria bacterium]|nr:tagatose-6-phosphate ketose isomerase [Vicinamibacteria bacterium]